MNTFTEIVEGSIILVPPKENAMRARYVELLWVIEEASHAMKAFDTSEEGKYCASLESKRKLLAGIVAARDGI